MTAYGLGIDAGGTYTDTVIVELESGKIMCGSKALTTRHDLSAGIRESIGGLEKDLLGHISLTSLSSTLATNSVVENKGCRVGLVCMGTSYSLKSEPECYCEISGKYGMSGKEEIPLNPEELDSELEKMRGRVDALAVSGYLSVRNPGHELTVAEHCKRILNVPVVCAHAMTSKLGFEQRTTTAVMNARLIPVIEELLASVRKVLSEFGINAPLMIVKGDGSLMSEAVAADRPVETVLSGPASSIVGAKILTGCENAVVVDIGGTTTDIGILRNGFPQIEPEGALLGGKRTRVTAANVSAFGIGGDSRIAVNGKETILSSVRAIPICVAASKWPSVKNTVKLLSDVTDDRSAENYPPNEIVQDTEFFVLAHNCDSNLSNADAYLMREAAKGPVRLIDAAKALGVPVHAFGVPELESGGFLTRIGITPTDILHAEGPYSAYDTESSVIAVDYLARKCGKNRERFVEDVKKLIVGKITASIMESIISDESGKDVLSESEREIIERSICRSSETYSFGMTLKYPIVGIGAPAGTWLPRVAEMLRTELILPERSEIGNAIGAISGSVSETVSVTVRAKTDALLKNPECIVFAGTGAEHFENYEDAMEYAKTQATETARYKASESGATRAVTEVCVEEDYAEVSATERYFRSATVTVTAFGKPELRQFGSERSA